MEAFAQPELWAAFASLLLLEIVLGIDNVVFISILAAKVPEHQQARVRTVGLLLALVMRILMLFSLSWLIGLTAPLFSVFGEEISGRDLVLLLGGAFLLLKSTYEIHERLEGADGHGRGAGTSSFAAVVGQIVVLDIVFSLDSVITAVGMVDELFIMVAAVMIAIGIMLVSAGPISRFVNRHPTVKMLALAFLLLIGASLIAAGLDVEIPKGYVYGPIAFAIFVELLNLRYRAVHNRRRARRAERTEQTAPAGEEPVHLRPAFVKSGAPGDPLALHASAPGQRSRRANGTRPTGGEGT